MSEDDHDHDWMAGLDWSMHRRPYEDYVSEMLVLSGVVDLLGQYVLEPHPSTPFFIADAGNTPSGPLVDIEDAFSADGTPIHSVHAHLGSLMRSHANELGITIKNPDFISLAEWKAVLIAGSCSGYWSFGEGARLAVAGLAPMIARLAAEERILTYARPIGGGPTLLPITGRKWWDLDPEQAVRRLASCSLAYEAPFDASAIPNHMIFVSRTNLNSVLIEAARRKPVYIAFLEYGDWASKRTVNQYAVQTAEVTAFLISLMESGEVEHFNNQDFKTAVQDEFGVRGLGRCFERAKAAAIADPSRARFGKRRPRTV